jgi:hypothetical protein
MYGGQDELDELYIQNTLELLKTQANNGKHKPITHNTTAEAKTQMQ